jgi:hypothetical protein
LRHGLPSLHQRQLHRSALRLRGHGFYHLLAQLSAWPKNSRVAQHMKARWWNEGEQPTDEAQRIKHQLAGAITKCLLHRVALPALRMYTPSSTKVCA